MGSVRQKRKRRSSRATVRQSNKPKNPINPKGNSIIAKNWYVPSRFCLSQNAAAVLLLFTMLLVHGGLTPRLLSKRAFPDMPCRDKTETLSQNYRRLGLSSRLQAPAGGVEPIAHDPKMTAERRGQGALPIGRVSARKAGIEEVRVERDERGHIVRIIRPENPLRDPLNALDSDSDGDGLGPGGGVRFEEWGGFRDDEEDEHGNRRERPAVLLELERQAALPEVKIPRTKSQRETEWLQRLTDRYGDDTAAMARDHRLNPMQQTASDIARRIRRWREEET